MIKYLFLLLVGFNNNFVFANTKCSCALGYRNGAQSSDINLCMGPSEGGRRPCYPRPCNPDWTACTTQDDVDDVLWTKDSTHTGKRPDCPFVKINTNGLNYLWNTLDICKKKCIDEPTGKCNIVSRYGDSSAIQSTEPYHCRFYACPDPNKIYKIW